MLASAADALRQVVMLVALAFVSGCGVLSSTPPPAPDPIEARAHLDAVLQAGIERDFDRLCSLASATCERELEGAEHLAPRHPPSVAATSVHQPQRSGDGWTSGGVLFVLCGLDAAGDPYESEVLVFDGGDGRLLATAAVCWQGTGVILDGSGDGTIVGEPTPGVGRC